MSDANTCSIPMLVGKQSSKDNASEHMPLQSLPTLSFNVPVLGWPKRVVTDCAMAVSVALDFGLPTLKVTVLVAVGVALDFLKQLFKF